jgi:GNAT superfamily N-acetyltransferase
MIEQNERSFSPVTRKNWPDLERLFGLRGASGGCWCMWWRTSRREFEANGNEGNRKAMRSLIMQGSVPGILAYEGGQPVGWCSIAPRETYGSLERSPVLKRIDSQEVWSLVCFYIDEQARRRGLMGDLIEAAVQYAASQGAAIVEAYPSQFQDHQEHPGAHFMGIPEVFLEHGFKEVAKPSKKKLILRRTITAEDQDNVPLQGGDLDT